MPQGDYCPCGDQAEFTIATEHTTDNLCPRCTVNEVQALLPTTVSVTAIPDEFDDDENDEDEVPAPAAQTA